MRDFRRLVSEGIASQAERLAPRDVVFVPPSLDLSKISLPANGIVAPFGFRVIENKYLPEGMGVMFDSAGNMTVLRFDEPAPAAGREGA